MRGLRRLASLLIIAFALSACALPVPVQVASWALDGISYLATKKTITDHGLSAVRGQDCALLRVVNGKDICSDYQDETIVVVEGDPDAASNTSTFVVAEIEISPVPSAVEAPRSARIASAEPVVNQRDVGFAVRDETITREVLAGNLGLFSIRGASEIEAGTEIAAFETASGETEEVAASLIETVPGEHMALPEDAALMRAWDAGLSIEDSVSESEEVAFLPLPSRKPPVPAEGHLVAEALPEGAAIVAGWDGAESPSVQVAEAATSEDVKKAVTAQIVVAELASGYAHAHQGGWEFGRIDVGGLLFRRR